jgi:hypothetical protein
MSAVFDPDVFPACEMLVRVVDKTSKDLQLNNQLTKAGDVIVVRPYPWDWSIEEQKSPDWMIVQSDMKISEAESYLAEEPGDIKLNPFKKRRFKATMPSQFMSPGPYNETTIRERSGSRRIVNAPMTTRPSEPATTEPF